MKLAKTGNIQYLCRPNAILTFKEYLLDYAPAELKISGEIVLKKEIEKIGDRKSVV